ncbi:class I SAM-dependent DNA methyltransferase [Pedobacter sp. KACC 23697]|uniref:Class I SAM-dependent methyltransferase n=1 Tax=Pedobacter sp. KACC 23697 TaxID=3149230 RepID=A0AAU7K756_9SPHI
MNENFKLYSQYYNLLYCDKDYPAEAAYLIELIREYFPNAKNIIELGSGTGKHALIFAKEGFSVLGLELSEDMLNIARQNKNERLKFKKANISDFKVDQQFEIALSLFHVISYLTDNTSLVKTFQRVHESLCEGGLFIFDVWHTPAVVFQIPEERTKKLSNDQIQIIRKATPSIFSEENIVEVNYDILVTSLTDKGQISIQETHPMRHFCKNEIDLLAYATGFKILKSEEFLTKNTPSNSTWGVAYVLKKMNS